MGLSRYSLVNTKKSHACMQPAPAGDWVLYQDAQRQMAQVDEIDNHYNDLIRLCAELLHCAPNHQAIERTLTQTKDQ